MTDVDAMIPRCSHGKILLGCPDEDCPEQGEYLKKHNQSVQAFLDLQQANTRAFVREYLGLPPEEIVPEYVLDAAAEEIYPKLYKVDAVAATIMAYQAFKEDREIIPPPGESSQETP